MALDPHMTRPYLSIVIPAYQEEARLGESLEAIFSYLRRQTFASEVVVVNDGSTDATGHVAGRFHDRGIPLWVLTHPVNRGKGAAVKTGMLHANGTYALLADADNATPIGETAKLISTLEAGSDIAIGSRYLKESRVEKQQPFIRRFMSRGGNLLFRLVLGLRYHDTRCGFKLFSETAREKIFPRQSLERFGFDTEILVIAQELGLRVAEVPVRWFDRQHGTIHPLRDSLRSLKEIYDIYRRRQAGQYRKT